MFEKFDYSEIKNRVVEILKANHINVIMSWIDRNASDHSDCDIIFTSEENDARIDEIKSFYSKTISNIFRSDVEFDDIVKNSNSVRFTCSFKIDANDF